MTERDEDLQATSDEIIGAARELEDLERERMMLEPGTARHVAVTRRMHHLASRLRGLSATETDLGDELQGTDAQPVDDPTTGDEGRPS